MKNLTLYVGTVISMTLVSSAAYARPPIEVPEPGTLGLVGGFAIAAIIASRLIRRK